MDLKNMPDDWLQDILIYMDFTKRKRLSRCCKKWRRLLVTKHVLRTTTVEIILHWLSGEHVDRWRESTEAAIIAIAADVHTIISSHLTSGKAYNSPQWAHHFLMSRFQEILAKVHCPQRCRMVIADNHLVQDAGIAWRNGAFGSVQFVRVQTTLSHMLKYFQLAKEKSDPAANNYNGRRFLLYCWLDECIDHQPEEPPVSDISADLGDHRTVYTCEKSCTRFLLDHLPPPCPGRLAALAAELLKTDLVLLQHNL